MRSIEVRDGVFFLVFDRGDDIIETLRRFATERGIRAGRFDALGAVERATIAWWSWEAKQYVRRDLDQQCEVAALIGDIAVEGDKTKVHAHVVLGPEGNAALAGHLVSGVVRPTLEMQLVRYDKPLVRRKDPETQLSLIAVDA